MKGCLVNPKQMLTWLEFDAQQKRLSYGEFSEESA